MKVIETQRLILRHLDSEDADFIFRLVNEPSWLRFIGDRGVKTIDDARGYIANGPVDSYARHGFGLYMTELKDSATPIGICGLIKRDTLKDVDVGFAFLPEFWGNGYAYESAAAALEYAKTVVGLKRIIAITSPDNVGSIRVLEKLGLHLEQTIKMPDHAGETKLFAIDV